MANKAIIGITNWTQSKQELRDLAHRLKVGEAVPEADYHLNFANARQLFAELTPARLALLETLKREGPLSIYALAKAAGRHYSNVHQDIGKLMEHELVAKDEQDRVYVPWDEVTIKPTLASVA